MLVPDKDGPNAYKLLKETLLMKLDHSSNVLVIVGGWNRHIFTEDWIKRYIFPSEQDEFK